MPRPVALLAVVAAIAALTGCASQPGQGDVTEPTQLPSASAPAGSSAQPTPSGTGLPTLKPPTAPPKSPTDALPTDRLAGRVTKGGSGPCYGLVTDDGKEYALYSTAGITLVEGTFVRVQTAPMSVKIYCGPGEHRSMVKAEPVK